MNSPTSASSPASAGSASPLKPAASAQLSFVSETPTASATSPTTGLECPSSEMSTTLTPSSAQLWPTPRSEKTSSENPATWQARNDAGDVATPPLAMSASLHSSSPQASPASRPVPPASARAAQMTAGSGRRLSAWLNASDPAGACLKTLLDSPRWHSPLRSLAWTLKGYGGVPDEPCAKSSEDLTFWDMTSRETGMASLGFRLCRLSQSEVSTGETGCGSSPEGELWGTPREAEHKGCGPTGGKSHLHRLERDYLDAQAQSHAELWASPRSNASTGAGEHGDGGPNIQTQAARFQTGAEPSSNAEPTASRGQLNPDFVCWLMGYPAGWLNYADSATPLSRKSPRKSSPPLHNRKASDDR